MGVLVVRVVLVVVALRSTDNHIPSPEAVLVQTRSKLLLVRGRVTGNIDIVNFLVQERRSELS